VQEAVGLALAKNVVFDVFANDAGAVFVTAAEQVAALVMVLSMCMNLAVVVMGLMRVRHLSPFGCAGMTLGIDSNPNCIAIASERYPPYDGITDLFDRALVR